MTYWGDTEEMEAEEELATLSNPVPLPEPATSTAETIDLLSSIPEEPPGPKPNPEIFPIDGLGGIPESSKVQDIPRLSRRPRPRISVGFDSNVVQ